MRPILLTIAVLLMPLGCGGAGDDDPPGTICEAPCQSDPSCPAIEPDEQADTTYGPCTTPGTECYYCIDSGKNAGRYFKHKCIDYNDGRGPVWDYCDERPQAECNTTGGPGICGS